MLIVIQINFFFFFTGGLCQERGKKENHISNGNRNIDGKKTKQNTWFYYFSKLFGPSYAVCWGNYSPPPKSG